MRAFGVPEVFLGIFLENLARVGDWVAVNICKILTSGDEG